MAHMDFVDFPAMKATKPHVFLYKTGLNVDPFSSICTVFNFKVFFLNRLLYPFAVFGPNTTILKALVKIVTAPIEGFQGL